MFKIDEMEELIQKLEKLAVVSEALEPSEEDRAGYLQEMNELINPFIANMSKEKSYRSGHPRKGSLKIQEGKRPLKELLAIYQKEVIQLGINPASGGHIGYIPGGGIWASALGDYLADISNEYAGMFFGSPGAVTMENEILDWLKGVFGFPLTAIGNLTSGGSIANLIALTAARDAHQIKGEKINNSVIYTSPQVHHCIQKALRIIGLEEIVIRYVKLDDHHRIDTAELEQSIRTDVSSGLQPFMVIGSAGTTDTGAIDPLRRIGEIASNANMWFHVDGAYGGFFILVESQREKFAGIELADSLVIDPHKGLFLPYGTGAVLVKNKEAVYQSHHYTANYMQDSRKDQSMINPADVSPELTKHFRGLRLWLPLQLHGLAPFVACLEEKILLTHYFLGMLKAEGFELGPEPDLSVSYFWYPRETGENEFNEQLMNRIHENGDVFLSSTVLDGRYVIRIALLGFRTKRGTVDRALGMIRKELGQLKM